jgi:hypothetical protein
MTSSWYRHQLMTSCWSDPYYSQGLILSSRLHLADAFEVAEEPEKYQQVAEEPEKYQQVFQLAESS